MAQGRQQNNGSRQLVPSLTGKRLRQSRPRRCVPSLEQLNRKLAAASAEIIRYQTRLFACERQMAALRQENASAGSGL